MKYSRLLSTTVLALGLTSMAQAAPLVEESDVPGEFSANVGFTTDYTFRGISQTDNEPAIQGGFDYTYRYPAR